MTDYWEENSNCKGRFYNWFVTWNLSKNDQHKEDFYKNAYTEGGPVLPPKLVYATWGLEKVTNLHIHYYLEFSEKVSYEFIKEFMLDNSLNCKPRHGTQKQAIDYVHKDDSKVFMNEFKFFEWGNKKHPGNRSDLDSMVDMIEDGYLPRDIIKTFRGNALRHISHIYRCTEALYNADNISLHLSSYTLDERRKILAKHDQDAQNNENCDAEKKCLEVAGNTRIQPPIKQSNKAKKKGRPVKINVDNFDGH